MYIYIHISLGRRSDSNPSQPFVCRAMAKQSIVLLLYIPISTLPQLCRVRLISIPPHDSLAL